MVAIPRSLAAASISAAFFSSPFLSLHVSNCDISQKGSDIDIPANQSTLVLPTNSTPTFVGLGYGIQNYTCSSSNNYTNIGAVAELIDVSCLVGSSVFPTLPDQLYASWNEADDSIQDQISAFHKQNISEILAQHYFVPNPAGQGLSPKWDFTSSGKFDGDSDAFFIGKGKATLPDPTNSTENIAWLDVAKVNGSIADEVFRTDTRGGQPPSSCISDQSEDIHVKYVAFYWFFGGSLN